MEQKNYMGLKDYLANISEQDMRGFLENELGADVESVIKYYDEAYGGHLFQVKMSGYYNLPREEGGFLRFGRFGLVKDDVLNPIPTTTEAYETMLENPKTLKKYILFVNSFANDNPENNFSYIGRFVNDYAWFALGDKNNKSHQASSEHRIRKNIIFGIQDEVKRLSNAPEKE